MATLNPAAATVISALQQGIAQTQQPRDHLSTTMTEVVTHIQAQGNADERSVLTANAIIGIVSLINQYDSYIGDAARKVSEIETEQKSRQI